MGYADNCIWFNGQLCFVEVKLNFDTERNFIERDLSALRYAILDFMKRTI